MIDYKVRGYLAMALETQEMDENASDLTFDCAIQIAENIAGWQCYRFTCSVREEWARAGYADNPFEGYGIEAWVEFGGQFYLSRNGICSFQESYHVPASREFLALCDEIAGWFGSTEFEVIEDKQAFDLRDPHYNRE